MIIRLLLKPVGRGEGGGGWGELPQDPKTVAVTKVRQKSGDLPRPLHSGAVAHL